MVSLCVSAPRHGWAWGLLALALLAPAATAQANILLVVADDLGVDLVSGYGEHPGAARTPIIDALAENGVLFRNVWGNPSCSPTRAAAFTGRYAHRTGAGFAFDFHSSQWEMPLSEVTLGELLSPTHETLMVGKWHLAAASQSGYAHPLLEGFDTHRGPIANLAGGLAGNAYFDYEKTEDGVPFQSTTYATTEQADDAIDLMESATGPWFLCLAFSAPHTPIHAPPAALHDYDLPADVTQDVPMTVRAMVEAMDTELGRVLDGIPSAQIDDTLVIFVGDNGTASGATTPPFDPAHAKGTVFDGGIRVPLIVAGAGVEQGEECDALVNVTDLFATLAEVAGVPAPTADDSVSLVPYFTDPAQPSLREWIFAERFTPNGPGPGPFLQRQRAARERRYKLHEVWEGPMGPTSLALYDLQSDPFETSDLLASPPLSAPEQQALSELTAVLATLDGHDPWQDLGHELAGSDGVAPVMVGGGELAAGETMSLLIADAEPLNVVAMLIGYSQANVPFKGGVLVPAPDEVYPLFTDEVGAFYVSAPWAPGVPGGVQLWWQGWAFDPLGPQGFTATNGITVKTQ
jgi:arylsulfatase B